MADSSAYKLNMVSLCTRVPSIMLSFLDMVRPLRISCIILHVVPPLLLIMLSIANGADFCLLVITNWGILPQSYWLKPVPIFLWISTTTFQWGAIVTPIQTTMLMLTYQHLLFGYHLREILYLHQIYPKSLSPEEWTGKETSIWYWNPYSREWHIYSSCVHYIMGDGTNSYHFL